MRQVLPTLCRWLQGPFSSLHQPNPRPVQARLANPVLAYVLAASPPLLLASNRPQQRRMAPWQGAAHAVSIAAAVTYARFAVSDLLQWQIGSRPAEVGLWQLQMATIRLRQSATSASHSKPALGKANM